MYLGMFSVVLEQKNIGDETMEKAVRLIENFCSFQGEGPDVGRAMVILRFKTCNLNCPWCDTRVKMRISNAAYYPLVRIQALIKHKKVGILVTGGEPTVEKHIQETLSLLNDLDYPVANVESNGYNLEELIDKVSPGKQEYIKFIFSPKIFTEEDLELATKKAMRFLDVSNVYFKIVYEDNELMNTYLQFLSLRNGFPHVYLMPEGNTREKLIEHSGAVFDACEKYGFNFSTRAHIIYGFV